MRGNFVYLGFGSLTFREVALSLDPEISLAKATMHA
jgi:hypothetical protein